MRLNTGLPVEQILDALQDALTSKGSAVLCAAPGAGKTTLVPPFLLDAPFMKTGRMLVLEPRRIAARTAACRVAQLLGERVGQTVGYRTRLDSKVSSATRIEFLTEGILTRMLQDDPALEGVNLVLFDEYHERSIHADLGLALCLDSKAALREDLRILVMSATLDASRVSALLDNAPVIASEGRLFPIETVFLGRRRELRLEDDMARAIRHAIASGDGDILAFLPGEGEIRRTLSSLGSLEGCVALPLYGSLPPEVQDAALEPDRAGRRKIILSTSIAETSLTVEGVKMVVDCGLMRVPRFSPRTGMGSLETIRVSLASAEQRKGRAGRLGPGRCFRLWDAAEQRALVPFNSPEISDADMAPLALELAKWGVGENTLDSLKWLDSPPLPKFHSAVSLLKGLGALDSAGRITLHGSKLLALPLHPRLAHAVLAAVKLGAGSLACEMAAILSERDTSRMVNSDIRERLPCSGKLREAASQIKRSAGISGDYRDTSCAGVILGFAYPDRIALWRRPNSGEYVLSSGSAANLRKGDPLGSNQFIVAAQSEGEASNAKVYIAAPISLEEIQEHFPQLLSERDELAWDSSFKGVKGERVELIGDLVLSRRSITGNLPQEALTKAFLEGLRKEGLSCIPWTDSSNTLRDKVNFLHKILGDEWPDMSEAGLLAALETWLEPYLNSCTRAEHLKRVPLHDALMTLLSHKQRQSLNSLAPERLEVPSGSKIRIEYDAPDAPAVSVKLQELFGLLSTPRLAGGRAPVTFRILSPSMRPVQVTKDLEGFWRESYFLVRKDMRGRYPKHDWPENPLEAVAHRGVRRPQ